MKSKLTRFGALALVCAIVFFLIGGVNVMLAGGPGDPDPGTVVGINVSTLYSTPLTGSLATAYSTRNVSPYNYNAFDVFVTADVSGTARITVTPQLSADGLSWANATYSYVGGSATATTVVTATTVSTSTATVTSTVSSATSYAPVEATYQIILSADSTDYFRMPMAGYYLRFSIAHTGTVTPTIRVVGRNN